MTPRYLESFTGVRPREQESPRSAPTRCAAQALRIFRRPRANDERALFRVRHFAGGLGGNKGWPQARRKAKPQPAYDFVGGGGGGHGLATAYYLAKNHGRTRVSVIEKGWLGGGNTGRNTTVVRSNSAAVLFAGLRCLIARNETGFRLHVEARWLEALLTWLGGA